MDMLFALHWLCITRIPSGIRSRLLRAMYERRVISTHGQKFDPESLYEPIKFETLNPYLVNKY